MPTRHQLGSAIGFALTLVAPLHAQSPAVQRGAVLVRTHYAQCHSIDRGTPSLLSVAPAFRKLHKRYPVESLQEALAEGIMTGHLSMLEFRLDPARSAT